MVRTQIYLTEEERSALQALAEQRGTSQSALIRKAVDQFIEGAPEANWKAALKRTKGMWADREDGPDAEALRREWDRYGSSWEQKGDE